MALMNELGTALQTVARVARQGRFWAAMGRALFSPGLLIAVAVMAVAYFSVDIFSLLRAGFAPATIALGLAVFVCILLAGPLLMRAWCPVAARAVLDTLQQDVPEQPLPSLGRFIGGWLLVMFICLLLAIPAFFIPRPYSWILLLPVALVVSGYHVRCALCIHASPKLSQPVLQETALRRTLIWFPLCALPLYLYDLGENALTGLFISPYDFEPTLTSKVLGVLGTAGSLAVFALVLVLWAALSLQALTARAAVAALGGRRAAPVAANVPAAAPSASPSASLSRAPIRTVPQRPPSKGKWFVIALGISLCATGIAYLARLPLMHHYLVSSDPGYEKAMRYRSGVATEEKLGMAFVEAACAGDLPRIKLLLRAGLTPAPELLGSALTNAARCDQMEMASFLIVKQANVNATPRSVIGTTAGFSARNGGPLTPLQFAVSRKNGPLVALLLSNGADPSLQGPEAGNMGPLHFAARTGDLALIETLVKAGAKPNAPTPQAPIVYFVEANAGLADTSVAGWEVVIARAERAGMAIGGLDTEGGNLLHWAAGRGQLGLIEVLLARGADRHQQEKRGAMPFMHLANWYLHTADEPGPQLEFVLKALTSGVPNINVPATFMTHVPGSTSLQIDWTIARAAAAKRRVRLVFGERIDYSMLGSGRGDALLWPLQDKEQAAALVADLSAEQLAAAPALATALEAKGWGDLIPAANKR